MARIQTRDYFSASQMFNKSLGWGGGGEESCRCQHKISKVSQGEKEQR